MGRMRKVRHGYKKPKMRKSTGHSNRRKDRSQVNTSMRGNGIKVRTSRPV